MITKKELRHIVKLARLSLTKNEEERFQKELSSILNYVEKLKEIDVARVEPTSHPFGVENVMREDLPGEVFKENLAGQAKKLLELAPETRDGYLKVRSIFEIN